MVAEGEYQIHFLGETPLTAVVDASLYEKVAHDFADKIENAEEDYIIDLGWALKALSGK